MKHFIAPSWLSFRAVLLLAVIGSCQVAQAVDNSYTGADNGNWNVPASWTLPSGNHFLPDAGFNEAAAISNNTTVVLNVPAMNDTSGGDVGGLKLALTAGTSGGLRIGNGGVLRAVVPGGTQTPPVETGALQIGVAGRGTLTVLGGGTISGTSLTSAGANDTSITLGDTSGLTANLTTTGTATLGRVTTVVGPNVNFNATGNLALQNTSILVADIRNATNHSALKTQGSASVSGTLRPQFTGFSPAIGNRWNLVDAATAITGSFATVDLSQAPALPLGAAYQVQRGTNGTRQLLQLAIEEVLVLNVNRDTGAVSISNPGAAAKTLDGYSILSPHGSLTGAWSSLDDQNVGGANAWVEAGVTPNALNELNPGTVPPGSTTMSSSSSFALGTPYVKTFPAFGVNPDDVTFEYSSPDGKLTQGQVVYTGTKVVNNLILNVDPATGMAALKNDSPFTIRIDGYSLYSTSGSLVPGTWNSLQDQAVSGWEEASPTANALAELKATGTLELGPGTGFGLGGLFKTTGATQDLRLEFLQQGNNQFSTGAVVYGPFTVPPAPGAGVPGDYNSNGAVDAADYVAWRNALNQPVTLPNDSTPGTVTLADYDVWRANFGRISGSGAAIAAATAVPEPSTLVLVGMAVIAMAWHRRNA